MTPNLDRVFDVKVVSLWGLRLKGAIVYVFRDGTGVFGGRFDGTPLGLQFQNQGEYSFKAVYKKLEKTQVVKPDEVHVTVRLGVRRSLTKAAVVLWVITVVAIWFLNAGIIPVGNPILSTRSGYTGAGPHVKPVAVVLVHGIFRRCGHLGKPAVVFSGSAGDGSGSRGQPRRFHLRLLLPTLRAREHNHWTGEQIAARTRFSSRFPGSPESGFSRAQLAITSAKWTGPRQP